MYMCLSVRPDIADRGMLDLYRVKSRESELSNTETQSPNCIHTV